MFAEHGERRIAGQYSHRYEDQRQHEQQRRNRVDASDGRWYVP